MKKKGLRTAIALLALLLAAGILLAYAGGAKPPKLKPIEPAAERDFVQADLTYDAGTRTLRGTQTMRLTNRTDGLLEEIALRAYMNGQDGASVAVSGAAIDGASVKLQADADDPTVLRAAYAWQTGETIELRLTLMVRHAPADGAVLVQLPSLAMAEDGAWRTDPYDPLADPSYAQPFDFTVRVDGEGAAQMRDARDVSFALLPGGWARSRTIDGVRVTALARDRATARRLMKQTRAALASLEKIGLPYPYETLTVAQGGTGREDGLALSGLIALDAQDSGEQLRRKLTRLIARETFGILVENDPWNDPWLSHSLASCAELLAYRAIKGGAAYETRFYDEIEPATRLTRPYGVTVGAGTAHFGGDDEMTQVLRDQGAAILLGIEQAVGEETFLHALRLYAQENAGQTAGLDDFAEALDQAGAGNWTGYLADGLSF